MNGVFLLDPRGIIDPSDSETVRRHEKYLTMLQEILSDSSLMIISGSKEKSNEIGSKIQFKYTGHKGRFNIKFIVEAARIIEKSDSGRVLIVAGDPWETLIQAFVVKRIIKFRTGLSASIQAQIHADVTSEQWKETNLINSMRFRILKSSLLLSDSVRVTSNSRKRDLIAAGLCKESKIVVSSVPLNIPLFPKIQETKRPRNIGFIGRLHPDRGLDIWIQTILDIAKNDSLVGFNIAGDGPNRDEFLSRIRGAGISNPINYYGFIKGDELSAFWRELGVLLSTAPSESFGRSIAESLVYGVPVWCVQSSGVTDLQESIGETWVRVIDPKNSAEIKMLELDELFQLQIPITVRKKIFDSQVRNTSSLAESWAANLSKIQAE
jgi:glycosyltransferase involved in cell wall biosynthesis